MSGPEDDNGKNDSGSDSGSGSESNSERDGMDGSEAATTDKWGKDTSR